ncbi:MAG: hypothetical protein ACQESP_01300 [Candidatus Muiribacteriota bacterium]
MKIFTLLFLLFLVLWSFSLDFVNTPGYAENSTIEFQTRTYKSQGKNYNLKMTALEESFLLDNKHQVSLKYRNFTSSEKNLDYISSSFELKYQPVDYSDFMLYYLNSRKNDFFDSVILYFKNIGVGFNFNGGTRDIQAWSRFGGFNYPLLLKHIDSGDVDLKSKNYVDRTFFTANYRHQINKEYSIVFDYNGDISSYGIKYEKNRLFFEFGRFEKGDYDKVADLVGLELSRNYFRFVYNYGGN